MGAAPHDRTSELAGKSRLTRSPAPAATPTRNRRTRAIGAQIPTLNSRKRHRLSSGSGRIFTPATLHPLVQFVDLVLAIEIQPNHDRAAGAVVLMERCIRQKHPALLLRDTRSRPRRRPRSKWKPSTLNVILSSLLNALLTGISRMALGRCVSMFSRLPPRLISPINLPASARSRAHPAK
jgi:hypothetical protein